MMSTFHTLHLQLSGGSFLICAPLNKNVRGILSFDCRVKPKQPWKSGLKSSACTHHSCPPRFSRLQLPDNSFKQNIAPHYFALQLLPRVNVGGPTQIAGGPHKVEVQACVTSICAEMVSACVATWLFQSISCMSSCPMQAAHTAIRSIPVSGCSRSPG